MLRDGGEKIFASHALACPTCGPNDGLEKLSTFLTDARGGCLFLQKK